MQSIICKFVIPKFTAGTPIFHLSKKCFNLILDYFPALRAVRSYIYLFLMECLCHIIMTSMQGNVPVIRRFMYTKSDNSSLRSFAKYEVCLAFFRLVFAALDISEL